MELKKLHEALEEILDSVVDLIEAENGKNKDLGVKAQIVRGDRARPTPKPPAVWVRGMPATPDHTQRSYAEKWILPIILLAIVQNANPEAGSKDATELAARARSIVLGDRTLNNRAYVQDVRSGRFEMSGPATQRDDLFAATAMVDVIFVILERNP